MEIEDLRQVIELLKETDITELSIEKDGIKVRIKRERRFGHIEVQPPLFYQKKGARNESIEGESTLFTVTSPIIGTFYKAPSPEAEPFVEVGAKVRKGQVLCIIEAMKLMNEIESEIDGIIVRGLVENGHPVEYGEPLFLIEPM